MLVGQYYRIMDNFLDMLIFVIFVVDLAVTKNFHQQIYNYSDMWVRLGVWPKKRGSSAKLSQ